MLNVETIAAKLDSGPAPEAEPEAPVAEQTEQVEVVATETESERVPYDRFEKVISERNAERERVSALEQELAALREPQEPLTEVEELRRELASLKENALTQDKLEEERAKDRLRNELTDAMEKFPVVEKELLFAAASQKENLGVPLPELAERIYKSRVEWAESNSWRKADDAPPRVAKTHVSTSSEDPKVRTLKDAQASAERRLKKIFGMV